MAELRREYIIPLRRKFLSAPKWRRSKKAVAVLKEYVVKHMKCENVIVCAELNEHIWQRGSKHPPGKVEVIALRTQVGSEEKVLVNLKSIGIDSQMKQYADLTPQQAQPTQSTDEPVVDTQASEKEADTLTTQDTKAVDTKENKEDKKNG
ncbi:MAG: 50S ribosomal protein L31e [Candidatus Nanoarchaeia archaeon]